MRHVAQRGSGGYGHLQPVAGVAGDPGGGVHRPTQVRPDERLVPLETPGRQDHASPGDYIGRSVRRVESDARHPLLGGEEVARPPPGMHSHPGIEAPRQQGPHERLTHPADASLPAVDNDGAWRRLDRAAVAGLRQQQRPRLAGPEPQATRPLAEHRQIEQFGLQRATTAGTCTSHLGVIVGVAGQQPEAARRRRLHEPQHFRAVQQQSLRHRGVQRITCQRPYVSQRLGRIATAFGRIHQMIARHPHDPPADGRGSPQQVRLLIQPHVRTADRRRQRSRQTGRAGPQHHDIVAMPVGIGSQTATHSPSSISGSTGAAGGAAAPARAANRIAGNRSVHRAQVMFRRMPASSRMISPFR